MMRRLLVGALALWASLLCGAQPQISSVVLKSTYTLSADFCTSLETYLDRYITMPADAQSAAKASAFLKTTYGIADAHCESNQEHALHCTVRPKEAINSIVIYNLAPSLLESELKRRLPVQVGQLIDLEGDKRLETLKVITARVNSFLKKNGFYEGEADVHIETNPASGVTDITIDIKGGTFVRVNDVRVDGESPLTAAHIKRAYGGMCLTLSQLVNAASLGTFSCYSKELERQTTAYLEEELQNYGFVKAHITVNHTWLDPLSPATPDSCRARSPEDILPRCVNLRVDVAKGPHVTWSLKMMDDKAISENGLVRFLGKLFATEQLYRLLLFQVTGELAPDQEIIRQELENRIDFYGSETIGDAELRATADKLTGYLIEKGYTNAYVNYGLNQISDDEIHIDFFIYPGAPFYVESVRILPEHVATLITPEQLDSLIKIRTVGDRGTISKSEAEAAQKSLELLLARKGFIDAKARLDLEVSNVGRVDAVFYVTSLPRSLVDTISIVNGDETLNISILPKLQNCDHFVLTSPHDTKTASCKGSSYIPLGVEQDAQVITDYYYNQGYLYAAVTSQVEGTPAGQNIVYTVYDNRFGPEVHKTLHKPILKGIMFPDAATNPQVMRRIFPTITKDMPIDPTLLKRGIATLRESGRFSRIDQKIVSGEDGSDDVYFMLSATPRSSLSFDLGASFSTDQLFSLEADLDEQNLFSSMIRLESSLNVGLFIGRRSFFNNRITWPYIWGLPLKLSINAPSIIYENRMFDEQPFRKLQAKVAANLEWRASRTWIPYLRYWLTSTQKVDLVNQNTSFMERAKSIDGLYTTFMSPIDEIRGVLKPGFSFIDLDNPYNPRSGSQSNNWVELSGGPFLGSPFFVNIGTQNRVFLPLGPLTLALQATFMRAFVNPTKENWDKLKNNASMDKLGGDRNVRGYAYESIGVTSMPGSASPFAGYFSNVANIELRFPLTKEKEYGNFSGALFVDQGMLFPCSSLFSWEGLDRFGDAFGLSVGAALLYGLPVGPISLAYGISPIDPSRSGIHLLFGYAF